MTPELNFYGLNFPELILFGILIYVGALALVIFFAHCIRHRTFCPFSGEGVHCTRLNSCFTCPNCSLQQSAKSVFCCKRNHSVYNPVGCEILSRCNLKCFRPNCNYLRCFCCEVFIEEGKDKYFVQKSVDNRSNIGK